MQPIFFLQGHSCILADVDGAIIEVLRHLAESQLAESHLAESHLTNTIILADFCERALQ